MKKNRAGVPGTLGAENLNGGAGKLAPSLANLEFLARDLRTADEFEVMFDTLLADCKARNDMDTLRKAREILKKQCSFMLQQYKQRGGRFAFEYIEGSADLPADGGGTIQ